MPSFSQIKPKGDPFQRECLGLTVRFSAGSLANFLALSLSPGVAFKMKTIEVDGIKVRIQIW